MRRKLFKTIFVVVTYVCQFTGCSRALLIDSFVTLMKCVFVETLDEKSLICDELKFVNNNTSVVFILVCIFILALVHFIFKILKLRKLRYDVGYEEIPLA